MQQQVLQTALTQFPVIGSQLERPEQLSGGTVAVVSYAGMAAERWLSRFSWIALVAAVLIGIGATLLMRERTSRLIAQLEAENDWETLRRH